MANELANVFRELNSDNNIQRQLFCTLSFTPPQADDDAPIIIVSSWYSVRIKMMIAQRRPSLTLLRFAPRRIVWHYYICFALGLKLDGANCLWNDMMLRWWDGSSNYYFMLNFAHSTTRGHQRDDLCGVDWFGVRKEQWMAVILL